jgi:hypothetical protein
MTEWWEEDQWWEEDWDYDKFIDDQGSELSKKEVQGLIFLISVGVLFFICIGICICCCVKKKCCCCSEKKEVGQKKSSNDEKKKLNKKNENNDPGSQMVSATIAVN